MKTLVASLLSVFFLFITDAANAAETADAPQFKVGDTWRISVRNSSTGWELYQQNESVTKIENGIVFYKIGNYSSATSTLEGLRISFSNPRRGEGYVIDQPAPGLVYPLWVGKTVKTPYHEKINDNITLEGETEMKVTSFEKKEAPVGTFDTFKLESVTNFVGNGPGWTYQGKLVVTSWYAPKVKRYVAYEFVKYVNGRIDTTETVTVLSFTTAE